MERFSDFADDKILDGEKIRIGDILGKEIAVLDYKIRNSRYEKGNGNYLIIQVELDREKRVIFTGSCILFAQLEKYKDKLPFVAEIIKNGTYYTFK